MRNKNNAYVEGTIVSIKPIGEKNLGVLEVKRLSGATDRIPFVTKFNGLSTGKRLAMSGFVRTKNWIGKDGVSHQKTYVYGQDLELESEEDLNEVVLEGFLCKRGPLRNTPMGKTVVDFVLAINNNAVSYYPTIIAWYQNAEFIDSIPIGTQLRIEGRFQSREYNKQISEGQVETRVAYEICARSVEVIG